MYRPTLRAVLTIALAFVASMLAAHGTARALSEFCPAHSGGFNRIGDAASSLYSFTVDAEGPRTVSGTIVVQTDAGWFSVPFASAAIAGRAEKWRNTNVEYAREAYSSAPMYVQFPTSQHIIASFVSHTSSSGDLIFGWDAQGDVQCSAPAGFGIIRDATKQKETTELLNPRTDLSASPPPGATIQTAAVASPPGSTDCKTPFADAIVTRPVPPQYPLGYNVGTVVLVEVLVDASGALADAWVFSPSGYRSFDLAALESARQSKYQSGTAFCKAAPGNYMFRAVFRAN